MKTLIVNSIKLITQDTDPSRRPGAGPDGYSSLKNHPFFKGIDWKNLRSQTPPTLAMEAKVYALPWISVFRHFTLVFEHFEIFMWGF